MQSLPNPPTSTPERSDIPDILRGIALLGICVANGCWRCLTYDKLLPIKKDKISSKVEPVEAHKPLYSR